MGFLHHPRRTWVRRACFQIHLWAGVIVSLYIAAIGLTGSILVFKQELLPRPPAPHVPANVPCTPDRLLFASGRVAQARPQDEVRMALCPTEVTPFVAVTVRTRDTRSRPRDLVVYFDLSAQRIAGVCDEEASWLSWVEDLHVNVLLGRRGRFWNGVGGVILSVLCVTGLIVWWPGVRRWQRALMVRAGGSWKRLNWDLHSAAGFWMLSIVLMWAATGAFFTWPEFFDRLISRFSPVTTGKLLFPVVPSQRDAAPQLNLPEILRQAQAASLHGRLAGYFYGLGPGMPFTVYMAREKYGDYTTTDFVYFNPYTGAYLDTWHRGEHKSAGDFVYWLMAPLHFGTSWGVAIKVVWAALGLSLPLLAISGLLMYWNRYLRRRMFSRPQPAGQDFRAAAPRCAHPHQPSIDIESCTRSASSALVQSVNGTVESTPR